MANRYWVGGSGNWSDATNHWSDVSGGSPGASNFPTLVDDIFFDTNSGLSGGEIILDVVAGSAVFRNLTSTTATNFTITKVSSNLHPYGDLILESGLTFSPTLSLYFLKTTGTVQITSNGCVIPLVENLQENSTLVITNLDKMVVSCEIYFYSGSLSLGADIECLGIVDIPGNSISGGTIYFENADFITNNYNVKANVLELNNWEGVESHHNFGSSTIWVKFFDNYMDPSIYATLDAGTSLIKLSNLSGLPDSPFFYGMGYTYHNLWITEHGINSNVVYIYADSSTNTLSNTLNNLTVEPGIEINFNPGNQINLNSLTLEGENGNLITIANDSDPAPYINYLYPWMFYPTEGENLVVNGDFTGNADGWSLGGGWVYDDNNVKHTSGTSYLAQDLSTVLESGHFYLVSVEVLNYISGTLFVHIGSSQKYRTSNGIISFYLRWPQNPNVDAIWIGSSAVCTIDSVSVKEVYPLPHIINIPTGIVSGDYLNISNSTATGGATFYAGDNSIDGGNNSGWIFTSPPSISTSPSSSVSFSPSASPSTSISISPSSSPSSSPSASPSPEYQIEMSRPRGSADYGVISTYGGYI